MTDGKNIRMILSSFDLKGSIAAIASKIAADHRNNTDVDPRRTNEI